MTFYRRILAVLAAMPRPVPVHSVWLVLAVSAALVLFYNQQLWSAVLAAWPGRAIHDGAFFVSIGLILTVAFNLVLQPFAFPRLAKPVLTIVVLIAAAVSYFASTYGAMMDKTMVANVFETDAREVGDLLSLRLVLWMSGFGVLPTLAIWMTPLAARPLRREVAVRGGVVFGSFLLVCGVAALFSQDYASLLRNHREVRFMINPSAAIYSAVRVATAVPAAVAGELQTVAQSVARGPLFAAETKKTVIVLVVGETARAANFSLNGYGRETNPELSQLQVVNFPGVRSCGTSTAESVPCMFSALERSGYSESEARRSENLLDMLMRAGVDVLWLENNSGCKGVCDRVPTEVMSQIGDPSLCEGGECRDEVMLARLKVALADPSRDTVIVMHQLGSHGPAYYKRYPARFRVFMPTCDTNLLQSCTEQELVNTYDNTILYTDHVLAETIRILDAASDRLNTAMLYVSDHGESLGENGMFLHGLPYMFAPDAQKHVPMVFWSSAGYGSQTSLDMSCVFAGNGAEYSHDNLFHSVLGMMDVRTDVYAGDLDLFAPCRKEVEVARAGPDGEGGSVVH